MTTKLKEWHLWAIGALAGVGVLACFLLVGGVVLWRVWQQREWQKNYLQPISKTMPAFILTPPGVGAGSPAPGVPRAFPTLVQDPAIGVTATLPPDVFSGTPVFTAPAIFPTPVLPTPNTGLPLSSPALPTVLPPIMAENTPSATPNPLPTLPLPVQESPTLENLPSPSLSAPATQPGATSIPTYAPPPTSANPTSQP